MTTVHTEFQDRSMTIGYLCQREVDTAEESETVHSAAQRMETRCVGSLVILDGQGRPLGIVTDRDIALRVVGEGRDMEQTTVEGIMTRAPRTVCERASIGEALARMSSENVRRLPVVDDDERLIGMVCLDDVLKLHAREFKSIAALIEATSPGSLAETS
jgi:CBS domain-containing protein